MRITRAWRVGGFLAALGASAALIASASGATGAWFTDSHSGNLAGSTGHLRLNVSDTTLNFNGLVPGQSQTKQITYSVDVSNGTEDVWLVFPTATADQAQRYGQFTGAKNDAAWADGGLGRYGHFAVSDTAFGQAFRSHNLQNQPGGATDESCGIDANGRGGSDQQATSSSDTPPYCGVPKAILLAWNLADSTTGTIEVTFGVTGRWTVQNADPVVNVPFQIVATQHGVRPDAANF